MGFPGLTTFIENNAMLYLQNYQLHDTSLVIDGCATACYLYRLCKSNMCFGGDYDQYGQSIKDFFKILSDCNITPYVIFDGCNESGELKITIERMRKRIELTQQVSIGVNPENLFPLFTRQTFYDIGHELGVKMIQCDFKSDTNIKNVARRLGCPVLSYDSDFYIYDGLYIPLKKFEMDVKSAFDRKTNSTYHYLECNIFNVDKLLNYHGIRSRSILPLLAVLLGNDDVKKNVSKILPKITIVKRNSRWGGSASHNHIRSVLMWLRQETLDSGIRKVLQHYEKSDRKEILDIINEASNSFDGSDSIYLKYLDISPSTIKSKPKLINLETFDDMVEPTEYKKDKVHLSKEDQELSFTEIDEKAVQLPGIFSDNFRTCLYPHYFMDIFLRHQYYYAALVEDVRLDCVIKTCFEIIGAIFKILTGLNEGLHCIGRIGAGAGKMDVPPYSDPLPMLDDIQNMNSDKKQKIFFKILNFDDTLKQLLGSFPPSWHIYILALIYTKNKSKMKLPLKYALILSKVILGCIDNKIGLIRSETRLIQKYAKELKHTVETEDVVNVPKTVSECLSNVSISESAHSMKVLLKYFEGVHFDRTSVHSITEFQTVLLHLKYLNNILQKPFTDYNISDCLNCTFVYNFTVNLSKQVDIKDYLESLLSNAPNVLRAVYLSVDNLSEYDESLPPLSSALEKLAI